MADILYKNGFVNFTNLTVSIAEGRQ